MNGRIGLTHFTTERKNLTLDFLTEGSWFGLIDFKGPKKYSTGAYTKKDATVVVFQVLSMLYLLSKYNELAYELEEQQRRLNASYKRLPELTTGSSKDRVLTWLLTCWMEFETQVGEDLVKVNFTHEEIASMTYLCRETVSRVASKLKKEGTIVETFLNGEFSFRPSIVESYFKLI